MSSFVDWLKGLSGPIVYAIVAALVFAEDALFVGFVLPGETAAVLGGFIAHEGRISLWLMMVVVVAAAILGDSVGYEVGRHFGPKILASHRLAKHRSKIERARKFLRDHGPSAVFLGRFVAFFRAMMPALSGLSRLPYPKFLMFNALGGLVWGVGFVLLGYLAGDAYQRVESLVGRGLAVVVAAIVIVALIVWRVGRSRAEKDKEGEEDAKGKEGDTVANAETEETGAKTEQTGTETAGGGSSAD
jgi:membrane protein DedA with SNARE-associated domain